jgi:hypothetical protein
MTKEATGVQTNGIGQKTTAHLNLTKTMATVFAHEAKAHVYPKYFKNRFTAKSREPSK